MLKAIHLLFLFSCYCAVCNASTYEEKVALSKALVGQQVQTPTFLTSSGNEVSFPSLEGKPTVAYFFASWCAPCYSSLKNLQAVQSGHPQSVNVVAISLDDDWDELNTMLEKTGYTGTVWKSEADSDVLIQKMFGNYAGSIPYTIKISADGVLTESSYSIKTEPQWRATLSNEVSLKDAELK